ncbi:DUF1566 domain-containing protein [Thalassotalea sp. HSM 43]|uniref:Lcl C-terminal domain-containing protein n=1 Tax=Thalassotalea sp. HSM 43 TaxID=2552945 RepID=UPI0010805492|nr:DUF1566 domain-containing protein [Thalassotalea sp. HSM 43]QBY03374.1 DUF1566 domain-containing protein [Thalassotalea sp. HSM 43]
MKFNSTLISVALAGSTFAFSAIAQVETIRGVGSTTQHCVYNVKGTADNQRFNISDDGQSVLDNKTGLTWARCDLGQAWSDEQGRCLGEQEEVNWLDAHKSAQSYTAGGHNDWRVPNIKELYSLVEERCAGPAMNTQVFPSTFYADIYFSSTINNLKATGDSAYAFFSRLGQIQSVSKDDLLKVKYVRD